MNALPAENVTRETHLPVTLTPMDMLARAVQSNAGLDMVEKLMNLQERWEANNARKAFDAAIAAAKAKIPPIERNAEGHNSKRYADFSAIAKVVDPILSEFGLSYRFRTSQGDRIAVTCVLSHKDGHSEETTLAGPADTSGNKNAIQAIGSTLTYLQRYSLVQMLGLAAARDDDGKAAGKEPENYTPPPGSISEDQAANIRDALEAKGASQTAFIQWAAGKGFFAGRKQYIAEIPAERYDACMTAIAGFKKG